MAESPATPGQNSKGSEPGASVSHHRWWRLGSMVFRCFVSLSIVLMVTWGAMALYWSGWATGSWRVFWVAAWLLFSGIIFVWGRTRNSVLLFGAMAVSLLAGWCTIEPSNHREWKTEVSVLPRVIMNGDRVRITGVRNFDYRSNTEFTPRFEDREFDLSHLTGVDFFVSYWKIGPVAHTFVSFIFDNAAPLCISIEARLEKEESYSPLASCFKQAELIYVVGDERDIVRVRTHFRNETVFLYHVRTSASGARTLLLSYLNKINQLADQPEFYHLLSNNCTVNIDRHAHSKGRVRDFDLRLLLNGYVDGLAYSLGIFDREIPFHELRSRSMISEAALAADSSADFSELIRRGLPRPLLKP